MPELTLYTNPMSRGRVARWMLEETGASYQTVVLDYGTTMKAPDYLAINPMGKVPALRHGDVIVTELAAICAYLADIFPATGLAPPIASPLRGSYYRWLFFAGPLEAAVVDKTLGVTVSPEQRSMVGYGSLDEALGVLEGAIDDREFLIDDRLTAVDVVIGASLGWYMQFGLVDKRPRFERYVAGLQARPAFKRAASLDDALLPPKQPAAS